MNERSLFTAKLKSSGLTPADAKALGIELMPASSKELRAMLPDHASLVPAMKLQYFDVDHKPRKGIYRVRLLAPPTSTRKGFGYGGELLSNGRPIRYKQPKGTPPAAYFPRALTWRDIAEDATKSLLITEGELKAACGCRNGFATIGLGGVWSWKSTDLGWRLLPELEKFTWAQRAVYLVFDSDAVTNPQVAAALSALMRELRSRAAIVRAALLPGKEDGSKVGLDDFLVEHGKDALQRVLDAAEGDEVTEQLFEFNATHLLVRSGDILYEEDTGLQFNPHKAAGSTFADRKVLKRDGEKVKEVKLLKEWLEWPHRREVQRFTFAPGQPHVINDEYNLWSGWGCEEKEGDLSPWFDVLHHLFPDKHREARDWFVRWLAFPIQNPGAKMATATLIWSTETGVGKSLLGFCMRHIYGTNWSMLNQHEFESSFTAWAERKQFVLVDDIASFSRKEAKDNASVMKTRITQSHITINIKYVAHYTIPDTINYYLTSNYPDALYLDEYDRRYLVHRAPSEKLTVRMRERFAKWRDGNGPEDGGRGIGPGALLYYLRHKVDLTNFNRWTEPPLTDAKKAMLQTSKSDVENWCSKLAKEPDSVLMFDKIKMGGDLYTNTELRALCSRQTGVNNVTGQMLGIALQAAGFSKRVINVSGTSTGLWAVRNAGAWLDELPSSWAKHYSKHMGRKS